MNIDELIKLDDVCQQHFNLSPKIARRRGALGTLPVPAFRLSGTRKGPLYLRKADLDSWVAACAAKAEKLNSQMRLAGAV